MFELNAPKACRDAATDSEFLVYTDPDVYNGEPVELLIMEEIGEDWDGFGVSATNVTQFLRDHQDSEVNVRINSPGGLVYDGMAIYNALASHGPKVTATIEGLAFSAASFIAMAADHVRMYEASSTIGIHRSLAFSFGNAKTMRGVIEWLDSIDKSLVEIYHAKTGQPKDTIEGWLDGTDDGTIFSAEEALHYGFADEMVPLKRKTDDAAKNDATRRIAAARNMLERQVRLRQKTS